MSAKQKPYSNRSIGRTSSGDTCAGCRKFPLQAAAQAGGTARCPDMEENHAWDDRACVLHISATDREHRKRIVIQLTQQKESKDA